VQSYEQIIAYVRLGTEKQVDVGAGMGTGRGQSAISPKFQKGFMRGE
jgi:hypothetical protein